jgi:hypothetical protein
LDIVYQADSIQHQDEERGAIGVGDGYGAMTLEAKRAWDDYRRSWIEMVNTLLFPNFSSPEAAHAIETLLTVERADELKHNILGIR